MYILDTDHLSILERGGSASQLLIQRLANVDPTQLGASIISYTLNGLILVGWVEERNPTQPHWLLGYAIANPTYEKLSF